MFANKTTPKLVERRQGMEQKSDSVLAHHLNNDLGVIARYCELMAEDAEAESESARHLHLILKVVHMLAEKINEHERRRFPPCDRSWDLST